MEPEKNMESEKKKENTPKKTESWIEKTEEFIEDAAEKIHNSDAYKKADQSVEKVTKKLFRQAGKLWGKSERYFKNRNNEDRKPQ